jgi:signal transduction histidine kinase
VNTTGGFVERVLRTGHGELIDDWPAVAEDLLPQDPERRRLLETMHPRSWIVVPLRARGQTFGSVTLATSRSARRYNKFDFELAKDFATRAAFAIDNARLYREAQEQAEHQSVLNVALRETIEERDTAMADLQMALRTRDEFLASASHDLKNPLASIKATAQLLERRLDRPDTLDLDRVREGLERVDAIATRAAGLVEELLDLARMQMGRPLDLERQPSDLVKLAMQAVDEHQHAAERHALRLITAETELVGTWDGRRLSRVLSNLLDNAVKYSPDGGEVELSVHRDGEWAVLEVRDHGIGIPAVDHDRVFERFQRASNVERRIGGTGIGLASARHIVDSHGGTIGVQSQEGAGATFVVRLPLGAEA